MLLMAKDCKYMAMADKDSDCGLSDAMQDNPQAQGADDVAQGI